MKLLWRKKMNKFKKSSLLLIVVCLLLTITACSEENTDDTIIATVNGKNISQGEYDRVLANLQESIEYQYGEEFWESEAKEFYEEYVLDELTKRLLLLDAAEKEGIIVAEEEVQLQLDSFKVYFQNDEEYKSYLAEMDMTEETVKEELSYDILINQYLLSKMENISPSQDDLKAAFEDLKMNEQIKASHILVYTEEEAYDIIDRINGGEDFAELAKELSVDTGSGLNGGDLDYFNYFHMVPSFSEVAFNMDVGAVSGPVESEYGYHIIKVTDKIVDDTKTVETEKEFLEEYFKESQFEEYFNELLVKLENEAEIVKK